MLIWSAMAVPVMTVLILYTLFHHKTLWWEFLIPLSVSALVILMCKLGTELSQTRDSEYWGGWMTRAEHYEDWNERVPCRHPKYETRTRTVNGRTETYQEFVGFQHSYDVDYHPEYWDATDSNGITKAISEASFNRIAKTFGNRQKIDLHRYYHTDDGDKFVTKWKGGDKTLIPFTTLHTYENRVQATDTIIEFPDVDPERYKLFEYPEIKNGYQCRSILGDGGPTTAAAERILSRANAKLGKRKQLRLWVLIFKNQPLDAGLDQAAYWKGGNKNEFVVAIGTDEGHRVRWCFPFSWTEDEKLKVDARNFVLRQKGKPLDLVKVATWLQSECGERFVRKEFADFDYLSVDPPVWAYILTFTLTIAINGGLSLFIIHNEFEEPGGRKTFHFPAHPFKKKVG